MTRAVAGAVLDIYRDDGVKDRDAQKHLCFKRGEFMRGEGDAFRVEPTYQSPSSPRVLSGGISSGSTSSYNPTIITDAREFRPTRPLEGSEDPRASLSRSTLPKGILNVKK